MRQTVREGKHRTGNDDLTASVPRARTGTCASAKKPCRPSPPWNCRIMRQTVREGKRRTGNDDLTASAPENGEHRRSSTPARPEARMEHGLGLRQRDRCVDRGFRLELSCRIQFASGQGCGVPICSRLACSLSRPRIDKSSSRSGQCSPIGDNSRLDRCWSVAVAKRGYAEQGNVNLSPLSMRMMLLAPFQGASLCRRFPWVSVREWACGRSRDGQPRL